MQRLAFIVAVIAAVCGWPPAHATDAAFTQFIASLWPEAEAAGEGVKFFLPKPYTAETMLRSLRELLHPEASADYSPSSE